MIGMPHRGWFPRDRTAFSRGENDDKVGATAVVIAFVQRMS